MALDIKIKQKGLFKKKVTWNHMLGFFDPEWEYGVFNDSMVLKDLDESLDEKELQNRFITIYDPSINGRGFSVHYSDNEIELSLPLPCTNHDFDIFYHTVEEILKKWKLKTFLQDDVELSADSIRKIISDKKQWNGEHLSQMKEEGQITSLPCATQLITVDFAELLKDTPIQQMNQRLETYLNDLQSKDVFVPSAMLYQMKGRDTSDLMGLYVVTVGVVTKLSIVPTNFFSLNKELNILWYIGIVVPIDEDEADLYKIPYDEFVEIVQLETYEPYDANSYIFTLNQQLLEQLRPKLTSL